MKERGRSENIRERTEFRAFNAVVSLRSISSGEELPEGRTHPSLTHLAQSKPEIRDIHNFKVRKSKMGDVLYVGHRKVVAIDIFALRLKLA